MAEALDSEFYVCGTCSNDLLDAEFVCSECGDALCEDCHTANDGKCEDCASDDDDDD